MVHRDELCDHPAGVVADQHHVLEIKGAEHVGDDARHAGDRPVGTRPQRFRMRAERPGRGDAPQTLNGEAFAHLTPELAAHHVAVHEDDWSAVLRSNRFVMDGSGANVDR